MKKAIAILFALALVGAVSAQDNAPYISGGLYSGIQINGTTAGGAVTMQPDNELSIGTNYWYLGAGYDGEVFGVYASIYGYGGTYDLDGHGYVYGYFNLLDGMLMTTVGVFSDATFYTIRNYYNYYDDEGASTPNLLVVLSPMDGLKLGMYTTIAGDLTTLPNDVRFLLKYSLSDMGLRIVAGYHADSTANSSDIYFGASYTGMENITADLEVAYADLGSTASVATFTEYVKYATDEFGAEMQADQRLRMATGAGFGLKFFLHGWYVLDMLKLGLRGFYDMDYATDGLDGFEVRPYATWTIGDTALSFYVKLTCADLAAATPVTTWKTGFDFVFSF
jgi:hypothetical protein